MSMNCYVIFFGSHHGTLSTLRVRDGRDFKMIQDAWLAAVKVKEKRHQEFEMEEARYAHEVRKAEDFGSEGPPLPRLRGVDPAEWLTFGGDGQCGAGAIIANSIVAIVQEGTS